MPHTTTRRSSGRQEKPCIPVSIQAVIEDTPPSKAYVALWRRLLAPIPAPLPPPPARAADSRPAADRESA